MLRLQYERQRRGLSQDCVAVVTRLHQPIVSLIENGSDTVAPAITERQREIAKLETRLRQPRPVQPKIDELRAALEQRAAEWRATLRAEPKVARHLLRRLIGPLTLADPADHAAFDKWEASLTPALLEGLAHVQVLASPPGIDNAYEVGLTGRTAKVCR